MAVQAGIVRPPSTSETSFNCPHCGALAKQFWFSTKADSYRDDSHPSWMVREDYDEILKTIEDKSTRAGQAVFVDRLISRRPFLSGSKDTVYGALAVYNVNISQCYNCSEIAIWLGDGMVWPVRGSVVRPNPDMPADALVDYEEASQIVDQSARGSAALLRLAIQKICVFLGCAGDNLNKDIATLVEKGLDKRIQKALDVVRVVGNNAVHPGEMDIRDDRATAEKLFSLVNVIVDFMISQPKHIDELFGTLPSGALAAIEKRDKKPDG